MGLRPDFVISDTHWYHRRIVDFCARPYDHEVMMVKRWANTVKPQQTILHLGDLFFGGPEGYVKFMTEITPRLTGKAYLILGNHDKKKWDYEALGFQVIKPFSMTYRGFEVTFDHYPRLLHDNQKRLHVHGHIHNHGYARGEMERPNNINVSVEMMDYRPARLSRLLNHAIQTRNGKRQYYNSRHYRFQKRKRQVRRAA